MRIQTKLTLAFSLLLMLAMGMLCLGIVIAESAFEQSDIDARVKIIENSMRRVAMDTLLQRDDLQLVSYVKFLQVQYPSLAYATLGWSRPIRNYEVRVGSTSFNRPMQESKFDVRDPADPTNKVTVTIGVDTDLIRAALRAAQSRLEAIILIVWIAVSLLGFLISLSLARSLTKPLIELGSVAQKIGRGQLGKTLEWKSEDEIGEVVAAFNEMSRKLMDLDEMKKRFLSSVTHELRSPLGAIESTLNLVESQLKLEPGPRLAKNLEYFGCMRGDIRRLGGFVDDLLDAAKIEEGKFKCALKPMRLQDSIREASIFLGPKAAELGIALENQVGDDLPLVSGDAERLRQVMINLLSNSLKFTPRGGEIRITAQQFERGAQRWIEIGVHDNGHGVRPEEKDTLFGLFTQGSNRDQAALGSNGSGLGLYIVKSIIEQHGGRISLESAPDQGTTVTFSVLVAQDSPVDGAQM